MSLVTELKRRNVFKVAVMYGAVSWLLIQLADTLTPALLLPEWTARLVTILLVIGFPIAVIFAWAFELTAEGLKPTTAVGKDESLTKATGKKLEYVIIGVLAMVVVLLFVDRLFVSDSVAPEESIEASIAVLPFADMSPEGDQEYFSDGISEELLNLLAKIPEMRVAGRTSSFAFKNQNQDLREIGETLGVAHVLEGSVRKQGMRVRITAQLIDADSGNHIWSETYDRDLDDIFAVQDEIAAAITDQLRVEILGETLTSPARDIVSVEAHNNYLMGLQRLNQFEFVPLQQAANYFREAFENSPGYMDAYAGYGKAIFNLESYGVIDQDVVTQELENLLGLIGAYETTPSANTLAIQSRLLHFDNKHGEERDLLRRAYDAASNSCFVAANFSQALNGIGESEESLEVINQALIADPLSLTLQREKAIAEYNLDLFEESARTLKRILDFEPSFAQAYYDLSLFEFDQGNLSDAIEYNFQGMAADPDDPDAPAVIALDLMTFGYLDLAEEYLNRADVLSPDEVYQIALWSVHQAKSGDYEAAYSTATDLIRSRRPARHFSTNIAYETAIYATEMTETYQRFVEFHEEQVPSLSNDPIDLTSEIEGEPSPRGRARTAVTYAWTLFRNGDEDRAKEVAAAVLDALGDYQEMNPYLLGPVLALLDKQEEALDMIMAERERKGRFLVNVVNGELQHMMDIYYGDNPRYQELVREAESQYAEEQIEVEELLVSKALISLPETDSR